MKNFLIIDIGTSSLRVAVVNENLMIKHSAVLKRNAEVCFDAEEEWNNIKIMIKNVTQIQKRIDGIAVSSLLGWVGVDDNGNALTPCYSYMHQCMDEYRDFKNKYSDDDVYPINGRCISSELAVFKIVHLQNKEPKTYEKIACFTSLKDFINIKLTGVMAIDRTTACYTMLYDIKAAQWSDQLIEMAKVDSAKLPQLLEPYELNGYLKQNLNIEFGLSETVPVAVGSVDGSTGILGAGGIASGMAVSVMGTTDVFFMVQDKLLNDTTKSLVINPHVFPGLWLCGGPMGMYGGTLEWFVRNIMNDSTDLAQMNILAAQIREGSEGVKVFPTLAGERTPFWVPQMRGTVIGLEQYHKSEHLFRAMMEANGYAVRKISEIGRNSGAQFDNVVAIGGGSKSDLWLQMKADIMGIPYCRSAIQEATITGSCILVLLATGTSQEEIPEISMDKYYSFDKDKKNVYDDLYFDYMKIHDTIVTLYG